MSKAAKKLHLTQPAVSFQMQKLERELGVRLLNRGRGQLGITGAGKRFFDFAEYFCEEYKNLLCNFNPNHEEVIGDLLIAANKPIGEFIVPRILGEFAQQNPEVQIKLIIKHSDRIIKQMNSGKYVVGFCRIMPKSPALRYFKFCEVDFVLITHPEHPFTKRKDITIEDLQGESLILLDEKRKKGMTLTHLLVNAGININKCRTKLITGSYTGLITVVQLKAGIAFVPHITVKNEEAQGLIKVVKLRDFSLKSAVFCVYHKESAMSTPCKQFLDFVQNRSCQ